jgi:hypothetical protein
MVADTDFDQEGPLDPDLALDDADDVCEECGLPTDECECDEDADEGEEDEGDFDPDDVDPDDE